MARPKLDKDWDPKRDADYMRSTWSFQRNLVRLTLMPLPFAAIYTLNWVAGWEPGIETPWIALAVMFTSVAACGVLGFIFWRCPSCDQILYRTTNEARTFLFFLSDPDFCPDCRASLRKPKVKAGRPRYPPTDRGKDKY